MLRLNLYATSHCHLCEQAETLLVNLTAQYDINWQVIEITEDSNLLESYGLKIPVIKRLDNNAEITWPFTDVEIKEFITVTNHA